MNRRLRARRLAVGCGVDLSQWHTVAVEWRTPDHLRGFLDGREWFRFAGGADADRDCDCDCVQCAPSVHRTIPLDNLHGNDLRSAVHEVDRARAHDLPDDNESVR